MFTLAEAPKGKESLGKNGDCSRALGVKERRRERKSNKERWSFQFVVRNERLV